jgi:hypothetical protein
VELEEVVDRGGLTPRQVCYLWDCLYLSPDEIPVPSVVRTVSTVGGQEVTEHDPTYWERIIEFDNALAAWSDLFLSCQLHRDLTGMAEQPLVTINSTRPTLRTTQPNLAALRKFGCRNLLRPASDAAKLLIVEFVELELRVLVDVLARRAGGGELFEWLKDGEQVGLELTRRMRGLSRDVFCERLATAQTELEPYLRLSAAALRHYPLGITARGLKDLVERDYRVDLVAADVDQCLATLEELIPGLNDYLVDDTLQRFAENLRIPSDQLVDAIAPWTGGKDPSMWLADTLVLAQEDDLAIRLVSCFYLLRPPILRPDDPHFRPDALELYGLLSGRDHVVASRIEGAGSRDLLWHRW